MLLPTPSIWYSTL